MAGAGAITQSTITRFTNNGEVLEDLRPKRAVALSDIDALHIAAQLHAYTLSKRSELSALKGHDATVVGCGALSADLEVACGKQRVEPAGRVDSLDVGAGGGCSGDDGGRTERESSDGEGEAHRDGVEQCCV